jgi:hypothetical protein
MCEVLNPVPSPTKNKQKEGTPNTLHNEHEVIKPSNSICVLVLTKLVSKLKVPIGKMERKSYKNET